MLSDNKNRIMFSHFYLWTVDNKNEKRNAKKKSKIKSRILQPKFHYYEKKKWNLIKLSKVNGS